MVEPIRRTVSLPSEMEAALTNLRKTDRFCKCSYSEIVRCLIEAGLKTINTDNPEPQA